MPGMVEKAVLEILQKDESTKPDAFCAYICVGST